MLYITKKIKRQIVPGKLGGIIAIEMPNGIYPYQIRNDTN